MMNGRIKQLAKESNLMEFIDGLQPIIYAHDIKRVEKFAELIVKECSYLADQAHYKATNGKSAGGYIRQQFGVE